MMNKRFEGKNVLLIGATGGLGESYARAFLKEGATVLLAGRNEQRLQELADALPGKLSVAQLDITDAESVEAVAAFAGNWADKIDVVVNATGFDVRKTLAEHQTEEIYASLNTNLLGAIFISKAFLPYMRDNSGSTIVHMGGFADGRMAFPYYSVDVATRSGIFSFVESMNRELYQENSQVRLTYFCPNAADTAAERPFHEVWREMRIAISPTEQVAAELLKAIERKKNVYLMGGLPTRFFAKLNALFPKLSDALLLKKYGRILKKRFNPMGYAHENVVVVKQKNGILRKIAICLVIFSFALYALLPVVPFLPVDSSAKLTITGGMMGLSEIVFWAGILGLGKELAARFKKLRNPCNWFSSCKASGSK